MSINSDVQDDARRDLNEMYERLEQGRHPLEEAKQNFEQVAHKYINSCIDEAQEAIASLLAVLNNKTEREQVINTYLNAEERLRGAAEELEHGKSWAKVSDLDELVSGAVKLIEGVRDDLENTGEEFVDG